MKLTLDPARADAYTTNQTFSSLFSPISGPDYAGHLWLKRKKFHQ